MKTTAIRTGFGTVTPYLIVSDVPGLIQFMKEAFGATDDAPELHSSTAPDGTIGHAELMIGDSVVMTGKSSEHFPPMPTMLHLYVEDVDSVYQRALQAGAITAMEPADQFYGERSGGVKDPFGNMWWISSRIEDLSPAEFKKREEEYYRQRNQ
jgi:PhnB protein